MEDRLFIYDAGFSKNSKYFIKVFLSYVLNICYSLLFVFIKRRKSVKKYNLSVCAIFKNEAQYFNEWIEYNLLVGVEHFYLYNNFSTDNYQSILQPYIDKGIVTLIDWPVEGGQLEAYHHCLINNKDQSQWIAFFDLDEFVCPRYEVCLKETLKKFQKYPSLLIYWRMFGTSGLVKHSSDKLIIEQYTNSWDKIYNVGKIILNTDFSFISHTHHFAISEMLIMGGIKIKIPPINAFKCFVCWQNVHFNGILRNRLVHPIQLNHYWSKAFDCFMDKASKPDRIWGIKNSSYDLTRFYVHEHYNRGTDHTIYRYLIQLKLKIREIGKERG